MRRGFSIILLACFALVSATFSYVGSSAHAAGMQQDSVQITAPAKTQNSTSHDAASSNDADKGKCSCKENAGTSKFVCSVTLAFCAETIVLHSPAPSKARFMHFTGMAPRSHIDELKRPPRTTL